MLRTAPSDSGELGQPALKAIMSARRRIRPFAGRTPLEYSAWLSHAARLLPPNAWLKVAFVAAMRRSAPFEVELGIGLLRPSNLIIDESQRAVALSAEVAIDTRHQAPRAWP